MLEVVLAFIKDYDLPAIRQNFDEMLNRIFFTKPLDAMYHGNSELIMIGLEEEVHSRFLMNSLM